MNQTEEKREEFHITSEAAALWYLRKLANLEAETRRVKCQAERLVASLNSEAESLKRVYQGELEHWAREELAKKGNRRKTLHTLQGTLRFRHVPARLSIEENGNALQYATESLPAFVITRQELDRATYLDEAKRRLEETGELMEGIERVPERETFTVSFASLEEN
ncbi:MAG: host-nuclease inhibitor Gam family protein [Armatimonadetes bacterium]|nr:host-nuclease inhibitor Gam family protein [Armatimonadota bacterium]